MEKTKRHIQLDRETNIKRRGNREFFFFKRQRAKFKSRHIVKVVFLRSHQLHMAYNSNIIIPIHYWLFDIGVTNATTNDASTLNAIQVANNEPQKLRYASTYSRIYILWFKVFCISFAKYFLFCVNE